MAAMNTERKATFKLPPTTITDTFISQSARRAKALEEQKRRRAQKFDSCRQLDRFAELTLGPSDDEEGELDEELKDVALESVHPSTPVLQQKEKTVPARKRPDSSPSHPLTGSNRKPKKKKKSKAKPSKWADKCMYAELLEMAADDPWTSPGGVPNDGLPHDLENGWVAVAPVPVGKRCLAITHQSSGVAGVVPNTTLRSRLLGKVLIQRFPSALPPLTVLDCILDSNWRENGILHILDVIKWKGQEICDCESSFRFWWRDTRLAELAQSTPATVPSTALRAFKSDNQIMFRFAYPVTLLPVPYHTDTRLSVLYSEIIPSARASRLVTTLLPASQPDPRSNQGTMDIDFSFKPSPRLVSSSANVMSDGLLLYVSEASYEAGTSPLSSWIPLSIPGGDREDEGLPKSAAVSRAGEGPLDLFQRLIHRRVLLHNASNPPPTAEISMDMEI